MNTRKNILILTSNDTPSEFVESLSLAMKDLPGIRAVLLSEEQYGGKFSVSIKEGANRTINRIPFAARLEGGFRDAFSLKYIKNTSYKAGNESRTALKGKIKKIRNALLRFEPMRVVCLSPYTLRLALRARKAGGIDTEVYGVCTGFTLDDAFLDLAADGYIVQNAEQKEAFVKKGMADARIHVAGMPLSLRPYTAEEYEVLAARLLKLQDKPAVLLNGGYGSLELTPVFNMMLDQGDIFNLLVRAGSNLVLTNALRKTCEERGSANVEFATVNDSYEDFLLLSDIVVTVYDPGAIYKAMLAGKSIVVYAPLTEAQKNDLNFLYEKGLILYAESYTDVVLKVYDIMQTNFQDTARTNMYGFVNKTSLELVVNAITEMRSEIRR